MCFWLYLLDNGQAVFRIRIRIRIRSSDYPIRIREDQKLPEHCLSDPPVLGLTYLLSFSLPACQSLFLPVILLSDLLSVCLSFYLPTCHLSLTGCQFHCLSFILHLPTCPIICLSHSLSTFLSLPASTFACLTFELPTCPVGRNTVCS